LVEGDTTPRVIATVGLHSSASTWVFNVVRELMIGAYGEARVLALYADEPGQLPEDSGRHIVIKSHHGSDGLDSRLAAAGAMIFLSMRDPRDACVSMSQRFKAPLNHTAIWLANDCNRLSRLATPRRMLLRYEDRFFDNTASVARLAEALGISLAPSAMATIFERYRTEAVRDFARNLADLPLERQNMVGSFAMDPVTQILGPHIGDTKSGKFRGLPEPVQAKLTEIFGPFLDRFGYAR
jgi:hypothetical protein